MYTKYQRKGAAARSETNMQSVAKKVQGYAAMQHFVADPFHNDAPSLIAARYFRLIDGSKHSEQRSFWASLVEVIRRVGSSPPLPSPPHPECDHHRARERKPGDGILQVVVLEVNFERPGFRDAAVGHRAFQIDVERRN
jgi:hypothetical protein